MRVRQQHRRGHQRQRQRQRASSQKKRTQPGQAARRRLQAQGRAAAKCSVTGPCCSSDASCCCVCSRACAARRRRSSAASVSRIGFIHRAGAVAADDVAQACARSARASAGSGLDTSVTLPSAWRASRRRCRGCMARPRISANRPRQTSSDATASAAPAQRRTARARRWCCVRGARLDGRRRVEGAVARVSGSGLVPARRSPGKANRDLPWRSLPTDAASAPRGAARRLHTSPCLLASTAASARLETLSFL